MRFDVEITLSTVDYLENFPWIRPSSFIQALASHGEIRKVLGGMSLKEAAPTLKLFWKRFKEICPEFELFKTYIEGEINYAQYIPFYAHGDEGTGYKKKGVLVTSFQPALGFGSRRSPNAKATMQENI